MVTFEHDDQTSTLTCRFSGELHTNVCMQLDPQLAAHISSLMETAQKSNASPSIIMDMRDVPFASSFFVRIVLSAVQRVGRDRVALVHCNEFLQGLFKTVGLAELLRV